MNKIKRAAPLALIMIMLGLFASKADIAPAADDEVQVSEADILMPVVIRAAPQRNSLFGVQVYGSFTPSSKYNDAFVESNATWIRNAVHWSNIEPTNVQPAQYQWQAQDRAVAMTRSDNGAYRMIGTIDSSPSWAASKDNGPIDRTSLSEFAQFVGAAVERYDGDGFNDAPGSPIVEYWEIFNEPDNYDFWGHAPREYAQTLAAIYPALKAANPNAMVVFGGLAHDWFESGYFAEDFLDQVLINGGGPYFDFMNFHTYPIFHLYWGTQGPGLLEKTNSIRQRLANHGYGSKPIVITETGWHSNNVPNKPSTEEMQARYVAELYVQAMAADVKVAIWWMFYDPGSYWPDHGLVTDDSTPVKKQAFYAYKTATDLFKDTQFIRTLTSGETGSSLIEAHQFRNTITGRLLYGIWLDPIGSGDVVQLTLPHPQVTVIDIVNGSRTVRNDGDDGSVDGRVRLPVTSRPVYVEVSP